MYDKFDKQKPFTLLDTSKYPPEVAGRFNSFITTQFDDSLSVEMQMRSIIKWAIDNFKEMDQTYNDFTEYVVQGNLNPFIEFLNDLIDYMNNFIETFDSKLTQNVIVKLNEWLDDGTLADIINNDVFDMKADKTFVDSEIERLDQKDESLTTQLVLNDTRINRKVGDGVLVTSADLSQDVKTMMTGGSVGVVGENSVLADNIVDNQVTPDKVASLTTTVTSNLVSPYNWLHGFSFNTDGTMVSHESREITPYVWVEGGVSYTSFNRPVAKLAFYNQDKVYQDVIAESISTTGGTFTPSTSGYVRAEVAMVDKPRPYLIIKTENFSGSYEKYTYIDEHLEINESNMGLNSVNHKHINKKSVMSYHLEDAVLTTNLFNSDLIEDGVFLDADGRIGDNNNYFMSGKLWAQSEMDVVISPCRSYVVYNTNGELVEGHNTNDNSVTVVVTIPLGGYLLFSGSKEFLGNTQINVGNELKPYEPYGYRLKNLIGDKENTNKLFNLKLGNLGDSIASAATQGIDGYADLLLRNDSVQIFQYAKDGATITSSDNTIITQVDQLILEQMELDVIVFDGLTNDCLQPTLYPLGEISNGYDSALDINTFCGAFEHILKLLKLNLPDTKIIYLRPHKMDSRDSVQQQNYGDKAVEILKKWSVPFIDLYNEGSLNTFLPNMKQLYTLTTLKPEGDGTHPNSLGYELFYYPMIKNKILSVI